MQSFLILDYNMFVSIFRHIKSFRYRPETLLWRDNGRGIVSNHQPHDCLLNRLFRRRSKKTSKLRVTGLCVGNLPGTGEFPAQMASNAEDVSICWRHHECGANSRFMWYQHASHQLIPNTTDDYTLQPVVWFCTFVLREQANKILLSKAATIWQGWT